MNLGDSITSIVKTVFENRMLSGLEITNDVTLDWINELLVFDKPSGKYLPLDPPDTVHTQTSNALIKQLSVEDQSRTGGLVKAGDLKLVILHYEDKHSPTLGNKVTLNSVAYTIYAQPDIKYVNGVPFSYTCYCRKGGA